MKEDISVLLVAPIPPPAGGDSTWTYKYLMYCKAKDYVVYHVNTSMIGKRSLTTSDSFKIIDEIKRCMKIWKGIKVQCRNRPSVVHMNTNCSPRGVLRDYISASIIAKKRIPIILHCRCNVEDQIGSSKIGLFVFRHLLKKCRRVLVQNDYSKNYLSVFAGKKVVFMPNYIESNYINSMREIHDSVRTILYVGHIRRTKGIDELLVCAEAMPDKRFVLAGPITKDYTNNYFERYKNVSVLGSVDEKKVKELLDSADLFLFPSYTEGFSNAVLEGMARGIPIITTSVGANKEMLENCGGVICHTGNPEELIQAIESVSSKSIRERMSKWNMNKVLGNYTIEAVMQSMRDLYKEVLDENC